MSTRRNIKYRYLKTKMALSQTVQAILDINKKRRFYQEDRKSKKQLDEELKVLNAVAENQARSLKMYEIKMNEAELDMATVPVQSFNGSTGSYQ